MLGQQIQINTDPGKSEHLVTLVLIDIESFGLVGKGSAMISGASSLNTSMGWSGRGKGVQPVHSAMYRHEVVKQQKFY